MIISVCVRDSLAFEDSGVNINIYFEGYTIHSGLPDTFKVFLLEFCLFFVTGFLLFFRVCPRAQGAQES